MSTRFNTFIAGGAGLLALVAVFVLMKNNPLNLPGSMGFGGLGGFETTPFCVEKLDPNTGKLQCVDGTCPNTVQYCDPKNCQCKTPIGAGNPSSNPCPTGQQPPVGQGVCGSFLCPPTPAGEFQVCRPNAKGECGCQNPVKNDMAPQSLQ